MSGRGLVNPPLLAALACLTRYAGVALLASTVLIVLSKPRVTLRKKVAQTLSYSVIAAYRASRLPI